MFKTTLVLTVISALLFVNTFAYVSQGDYSDPAHPGKCVIEPDVIVGPGMHQHPKDCARIECQGGYAEIAGCGVEGAAPGCKLGNLLHPDANYPDCCQHEVICDD